MGMYDGLDVVSAPAAAAPSMYDGLAVVNPNQREASGAMESLRAGFQGSATGLAWRGKLPDLVMNPENAKWWERALTGVGQVGSELPIMAVGGALGGQAGSAIGGAVSGPGAPAGAAVGGILGTGAGMFALPGFIRESLVQAYSSGEVKTPEDWWNILRAVATTTTKEAVIGAATTGAGAVAARTLGKAIAPSIGTGISVPTATKVIGTSDVAAQIATMTSMPAAFQGRLPTLQEFMDGAILVGGLKVAHSGATRLANIYQRTGKTPAEVVQDARENPEIAEEIANPFVPPKLDRLIGEAEQLGRGGMPLAPNVKNIIAEIKSAPVDAPEAIKPSLQRIFDDVKQQFTEAGRAGEAEQLAALERARYRVLGEQFNKDPWEMYSSGERPALQVRGEGIEPAPTVELKIEPVASKKYSPEIEAELADAKKDYESRVEFYKRNNTYNPAQLAKDLKGAGMRYAAIKREITGELTGKEQAAKDKREAGNYIGKPVVVDGKPAKITANPFGKVSVIFEDGTKKTVAPEQIKLAQDNRGAYTPSKNLIEIFKTADASTGLHELSHSWLEEFKAYAARPDAPASLKTDWNTIRRELAIPENGEISVAAHELWARGTERYAAEGRAPSRELQSVFERFSEWLMNIYKTLTELNVEISPDMRAVMDRMLATSEQIADARQLGVPRAYVDLAKANEARKIVPGFKAEQVSMEPYADSLPKGPGEAPDTSHVNYQYINSPLDVKLTMQRMAEIDQENIQKQRGGIEGVKSWEMANAEQAAYVNDILGGGVDTLRLFAPREPNQAGPDVRLGVLKKLAVGAAKDSARLRDIVLERGVDATVREQLEYMGSIERARMIQAEFLGERASVARALNALKDVTEGSGEIGRMLDAIGYGDAARLFQSERTPAQEAAFLKAKLDEIMLHYNGRTPLDIAKLHKEIRSLSGTFTLAKAVSEATTWEKIIEGWKAGLLSGPVTHTTNLFGTGAFQVLRAPVDALASGIGLLRGASVGIGATDRASMMEPLARLTGYLGGTIDGIKVGVAAFKADELTAKTESYKQAIGGVTGQVIRTPLRLMAAEDAMVTTMYERGEMKTLAMRQAFADGINPLTRDFAERMDYLMEHPTDAMKAEAMTQATRMTFNAPLGEKGLALQHFVNKWNLQWMVPFIRTPINIAKELGRFSPFAPVVAEWRADIAKGGVARDRAIAEIALGSGIMALTMSYAFDGSITGAGSPDPGKNRAKVGVWQPYSVLVNGTWYEYARIQPTGTLMGLAADLANVWEHMTDDEKDKTPKMLAIAFSNAVTNQTFLQGITNVVGAMSEPDRKGPKFAQQLVGSLIPNIIAQPTAMADPLQREVGSILEAVQARLPGLRQDLLPKVDWLGDPVQARERLGVVAPVRVLNVSEDKVRTEAARLDISVAATPKKVHIGKGTGKTGDVEITPDERNVFATTGGKLAHKILSDVVAQPSWDATPDEIKKRIFRKVLTRSHGAGAMAALSAEKRQAYAQDIAAKMADLMVPEEVE